MGKGLRIVDDADSFPQGNSDSGGDDEVDEMPQFAGVVDERPTQVQAMELFQEGNRWKQFGDDEEDEAPMVDNGDESTIRNSSGASSPATRTLDGKKAGLQTSAALRDEMLDFRKREDELFAQMDDSISGRRAKTKVRSRLTREEREAEELKKAEDAKKAEERKKQYDKWGKGLKQVEDHKNRLNADLHEVSKPLARYKDDKDLDEHLRAQERDGDPMLAFMKSKAKSSIPGSKKQTYMGAPPPPNRFKIPPGYRWDGVDRSNGYEKSWFGRINDKKAQQEDAYKWSVEDL